MEVADQKADNFSGRNALHPDRLLGMVLKVITDIRIQEHHQPVAIEYQPRQDHADVLKIERQLTTVQSASTGRSSTRPICSERCCAASSQSLRT